MGLKYEQNVDIQTHRQRLAAQLGTAGTGNFEALALEVFRYQAQYNPLYAEYLRLLAIDLQKVDRLERIPFLPIQFFKTHAIQTGQWAPALTFSSSGTSGMETSRHLLRDPDFYRANARRGFEAFYGSVQQYCILALLPAYLERQGSSLVFMADDFIRQSAHSQSGFFLHDLPRLAETLAACQQNHTPTLLLGVSFALWELAERYPMDLSNITIMETGGMKGRRRELTREELHAILQEAFQTPAIHSEYGMTELLSQAYSQGKGLFRPSPTLRALARDITDPFGFAAPAKNGALNLIDLANLDTISFIATDDLGRVYEDGSFEVLGRLDASDARGCNLLVVGG
jgi:hypothetical protein